MRIELYVLAAQYQLKSLFRLPAYWVPTVLFPVMLFAMFGSGGSGRSADYRMASFVVYGVIGVAFFQFGVSIAQDRESHWERYRRSLPGAAGPHLVSQLLSAVMFSLLAAAFVVIGALILSAPTVGMDQVLILLAVSLAVAVPFTLLGVALGYWTTPKSAVAVANLIYLPMAYLGGLWMPPNRLPGGVAELSLFTPTRHAGEIAWSVVGGRSVPGVSVFWLIGFSVGFGMLAFWGYQRDEKRRYA